MANRQIYLDGKVLVTVRDTDHIATGGEGSIYKISPEFVVKLFTRPDQMVKRGLDQKILLLAQFSKDERIVAPIGLVMSKNGSILGYYMKLVNGHPLSRVFTNEFYRSEGFNSQHASTLVEKMHGVVDLAHSGGAVIVDANELNWIVKFSGSDPDPRVVDVDSWSIGKWPATVIMPSIRDYHSNTFDQKSDYFSLAIITFQIYTGIHPYKGTLDGFDRSDLVGRMKQNASVFTPGIRLNRAVRDFSCIPGPLRNWYEATFQNGERVKPPSPFDKALSTPKAIQILRVTTNKTGTLIFDKLFGVTNNPVTHVYPCGIARLASGALVDIKTKKEIVGSSERNMNVVKIDTGWLVGEIKNGISKFTVIDNSFAKKESQLSIKAQHIVVYENRMFVASDEKLIEISTVTFGKNIVVSAGQNWGVIMNSTKWFDGCGALDTLGAKYLIVPFAEKSVQQVRVKELDGIQIISGKAGNRFASLIGINKKGEHKNFELTFNADYTQYAISCNDSDDLELNLAILPKGVCAKIVKDGELIIFVPVSNKATFIEDKQIQTDMNLCRMDNNVLYIQDGAVWSVRMR